MPILGSERVHPPKVATLETCGPCFPWGQIDGYNVVRAARELREKFAKGAGLVQVRRLRQKLHDFGGRNSGGNAILPHVDHFGDPDDDKWILMLSLLEGETGHGAPTFVATREAVPFFLRIEERWFLQNQKRFGEERDFDPRFSTRITKEEYDSCFDEAGEYRRVATAILERNPQFDPSITRLNLLGFLMRGPSANEVMEDVMAQCAGMYVLAALGAFEMVALNNRTVVHGRAPGTVVRRQRNFAI